MTERIADTISGLFLIAVALVAGAAAQFLPTTIANEFAGPSFMPTLVSMALGICGAGIVFQARALPETRRMPGWSETDRAGAIRIAVVALAIAAYNLLLEPLGYLIVTFDDLVKSRKCPRIVIPVKTGIQRFRCFTKTLDTGFHRCDDFLRERHLCFPRFSALVLEGVVVLESRYQSHRDGRHLCAVRHLAQGCTSDGAS